MVDHTTGDISFYEDTGTTAKLFWDASAERLGVGTITPNAPVDAQLNGIGGLPVSSGTAQTYGSLRVGATSFNTILDMGTAGATGAWLQASDRTGLGTNYSLLLNPNGGNVGINTSSPTSYGNSQTTLVIEDSGSPAIAWSDTGQTRDWFAVAQGSGLYFNYADGGGSGSATNVSEVLVLDNSGNVGIGTSNPQGELHIKADTPSLYIQSDDGQSCDIIFGDVSDQSRGRIRYDSSDNMIFQTNNLSEKMRISSDGSCRWTPDGTTQAMTLDASNNLLVGKTQSDLFTAGAELTATGQVYATVNAAPTARFNRKTSDGDIVDFRKDDVTVGSIGVESSKLNIGTGDTGIEFNAVQNAIIPHNQTTNVNVDNSIDLGFSSLRFRDLYLSGGLRGDTTFKNSAGTTEYARFDSSGNLLIGMTNDTPGLGDTDTGASFRADGASFVSRTLSDTSGSTFYVNRNTNDGNLIQFQKDGTTVGSIGTISSGDLYIADGRDAGLKLDGGNNQILAVTSAGAQLDNTLDLGKSDTRFKDLYLSGGVYLGGTGSANKLDDYEEGTFSPTLYGASSAGTTTYATVTGTYTKVGNRCTINFVCSVTATTGTGSLRLGGLPFSSSGENTTALMINNLNWGGGTYLMAYVGDNDTFARVYYIGDDNTWQQQQITNEAQHFIFTLTYQTA
jgi:hypothetical protein